MSAATSAIPDLKRIQFFTGQRLTAQDLTDVQDENRELRWLHNRSLHGWGIGIGYAVSGEAGDTAVTISPGYAIDCLGRELILTESVTMTVPATAGVSSGGKVAPATFFLTISYLDDPGQSTVESRPGVCLPGGTVRLTEGPLIQWQQFKDIADGMNVILAEASVLNCQLNAPLGLDVRRSARPAQQPYIAAGQLTPAEITWVQVPGGIRARVDTSASQFGAVPAYFAHVMGPRQVRIGSGEFVTVFFLITVAMVDNPAQDGFFCDVLLLMFDKNNAVVAFDPVNITELIPALQWTIVWMGIEG
jgi:hypothetical protein